MIKGICLLPIIPMRKKPSDKSEMINQILFGENFKILTKNKTWSYIELTHDQYKGWIDNKQYNILDIPKYTYNISTKKYCNISIDKIQQTLIMGSLVPTNKLVNHKFKIQNKLNFNTLDFENGFIKISKKYLNAPYLWGGRSPLGIDCSGYTQMVYRFFGKNLPRDSYDQAKKGRKISNITKIKTGDLAFFSTKKSITHVGIILPNHQIIHASGKVRIDSIDSKGIFNKETSSYTHNLILLKRII